MEALCNGDYGKMEKGGIFRRTGSLNKPPRVLLVALQTLQTNDLMYGSSIPAHLESMGTKHPRMAKNFCHQGAKSDQLFQSAYNHPAGDSCEECDTEKVVNRPSREDAEPFVHYGNIASGDEVMKDGTTRDRIAKDEGVICFEMEAAGLMDSFPCLVIRGICDYADSHKNKRWAAICGCYRCSLCQIVARGDRNSWY